MDQTLKQRLLGVIVITALAAIFLPMLFDNPVEDKGLSISDLTIPSFSEDFFEEQNNEPALTSAEQVLALPEPDYIAAESELEEINTLPEQQGIELEQELSSGAVVLDSDMEQAVVAEQSRKKQPGLKRWYVQAASLSTEQNARIFQNKLLKQGFNAFYDTFTTSRGKQLFRVRVGPELDRKRVLQMQERIDKLNHVKSSLVRE